MNDATRDQMEYAARMLEDAANKADAWYPRVEQECADDMSAYRDPRDGSPHKEARSDVRRANG